METLSLGDLIAQMLADIQGLRASMNGIFIYGFSVTMGFILWITYQQRKIRRLEGILEPELTELKREENEAKAAKKRARKLLPWYRRLIR